MRPEDLLDQVHDRDSFLAFVEALAEERASAQEIEKAHPDIYVVDGAMGWKNGDIARFLEAAMSYFADDPSRDEEKEPSWTMFANFLYCGKIIE
jgi:hypothetical protein